MKLREATNQDGSHYGWIFWCPGCEGYHCFGPDWGFDGNLAAPTFSPSLVVLERRQGQDVPVCHLFLRAGRLEFLADCHHHLAGQTVDLPDDPAEAA